MNNTSMNMGLFTEAVIQHLNRKMGEDVRIFSNVVRKNNGIELTGIIIEEKGSNTSPAIYINDFYEEYRKEGNLEKTVQQIYEIYQQSRYEGSVDLTRFLDFEKAREQIAVKVINCEKNQELLQEIPHRVMFNLALVFYYVVSEAPFCGRASVLITHAHRRKWEISEEDLYRCAMENSPRLLPPRIENIEDVMIECLKNPEGKKEPGRDSFFIRKQGRGQEENLTEEFLNQLKEDLKRQEDTIPMYVLSNEQKLLGAACLFYPDVLRNFAARMQSNLYILPSSIHEVILLPDSERICEAELLEMVTEINRTQVEESEVLADAVYFYNRRLDYLERRC